MARKGLVLAIMLAACSRHAASGTPAPDLRAARDACDTLAKLQKAAVAENSAPGYLAQRGVAAAPACVARMRREQQTTHETLGALAKLPDTVPGISALRQAVFQVHICVSCTPSADQYCARAGKLLAQARAALDAARP